MSIMHQMAANENNWHCINDTKHQALALTDMTCLCVCVCVRCCHENNKSPFCPLHFFFFFPLHFLRLPTHSINTRSSVLFMHGCLTHPGSLDFHKVCVHARVFVCTYVDCASLAMRNLHPQLFFPFAQKREGKAHHTVGVPLC